MTRIPRGIPATDRSAGPPNSAEAFIAAAPGKTTYPWQDPRLDSTARRPLNADVPPQVLLKLGWLAFHSDRYKRDIVRDALTQYIDAELRRMGIEP